VKPARRRRGWRSYLKPALGYGVLAIAVIYALYRGSKLAVQANVLRVSHVALAGNERMSRGEVLAVLSGLTGESLLTTDLERWRGRVLASPWVRDAALRRSLPSTIEVEIWERRPAAIGRMNSDMYLIDDRGVLIDQYGPQYADLDLPIVDGLVTASSPD